MKYAVKMYNNDITPALVAFLKHPHTPEEWAAMDDDSRAFWTLEAEKMAPRTLEGIWRLASEGALTREGGRIEQGNSDMVITLDTGKKVRLAQVGDTVVYPDGTRARIISGTGDAGTFGGASFALVGSLLDNGDEIICTPQNVVTLVRWDNSEPFPDNFLKPQRLAV